MTNEVYLARINQVNLMFKPKKIDKKQVRKDKNRLAKILIGLSRQANLINLKK